MCGYRQRGVKTSTPQKITRTSKHNLFRFSIYLHTIRILCVFIVITSNKTNTTDLRYTQTKPLRRKLPCKQLLPSKQKFVNFGRFTRNMIFKFVFTSSVIFAVIFRKGWTVRNHRSIHPNSFFEKHYIRSTNKKADVRFGFWFRLVSGSS